MLPTLSSIINKLGAGFVIQLLVVNLLEASVDLSVVEAKGLREEAVTGRKLKQR